MIRALTFSSETSFVASPMRNQRKALSLKAPVNWAMTIPQKPFMPDGSLTALFTGRFSFGPSGYHRPFSTGYDAFMLNPSRSHSATLDEEVLGVTFPSGLTCLLCPKPGFKKKYACYSTFYGSVDSEFIEPGAGKLGVPDGIAHFLEHTLFESEEGNVSDLFSKLGAYNNAATSFTTTTYLFAASHRFYDCLDLLMRFVENPSFRTDKVEKEKGIIEQEIKGYDDNPHWVSYMGLLENLFVRHPMRIDIAGTPETIRKIDPETLNRCYRSFYSPANMILFVVGDVEPERLFAFVADRSRNAKAPPANGRRVERIYPEEPREVARRETRKAMEVALPKLLLGFKEVGVPLSGEEFVLRELASELALEILFGKSSDTFRDLYAGQVILDDFGASYSMSAGVGYGIVGGGHSEAGRAPGRGALEDLEDAGRRHHVR